MPELDHGPVACATSPFKPKVTGSGLRPLCCDACQRTQSRTCVIALANERAHIRWSVYYEYLYFPDGSDVGTVPEVPKVVSLKYCLHHLCMIDDLHNTSLVTLMDYRSMFAVCKLQSLPSHLQVVRTKLILHIDFYKIRMGILLYAALQHM